MARISTTPHISRWSESPRYRTSKRSSLHNGSFVIRLAEGVFLRYQSVQHPDGVSLTLSDDNDDAHAYRADLQSSIRQLLVTDRLVVLLGAGSSLAVLDDNGAPVAPSMSDLWETAKGIAGDGFEDLLTQVKYVAPESGDNIEVLLSRCLTFQEFAPDAFVQSFVEKTEAEIIRQCRFAGVDTNLEHHEAFLRRVARRPPRKARTRFFTTNYDTVIEEAASRLQFTVIDGFSHASPPRFDGSHFDLDVVLRREEDEQTEFLPKLFHLHKLHGSVDWKESGQWVEKDAAAIQPLIIYPRANKYERSYDPPFFEMMARFQAALRRPDTAVMVVGFGFNDTHIVRPILNAVESNVALRLMVVDVDLGDSRREPIPTLKRLVRNGDARIELVECGFNEFVALVPDLVAETESERHIARFHEPDE